MSRFVKVLVSVAFSALMLAPARAEALTLQEIIELSRAGLGEEVLLALIEVNQRVYPIDTETVRTLKGAGLSEKIIIAIVKSGRTPPPPVPEALPLDVVPPPPPEPQVIVVERERPVVTEVPVPVYVAVTWPDFDRHDRRRFDRHDQRRDDDNRVRDDKKVKHQEPVYWGWGGKLRPDAWQPASPPARRGESKR